MSPPARKPFKPLPLFKAVVMISDAETVIEMNEVSLVQKIQLFHVCQWMNKT